MDTVPATATLNSALGIYALCLPCYEHGWSTLPLVLK